VAVQIAAGDETISSPLKSGLSPRGRGSAAPCLRGGKPARIAPRDERRPPDVFDAIVGPAVEGESPRPTSAWTPAVAELVFPGLNAVLIPTAIRLEAAAGILCLD